MIVIEHEFFKNKKAPNKGPFYSFQIL